MDSVLILDQNGYWKWVIVFVDLSFLSFALLSPDLDPVRSLRVSDAVYCPLRTAPYQPKGDPSALFPGTYYLTNIDDKHRRQYSRAP